MTETMKKYGIEFARTADGGWLEVGAELPEESTAKIRGEAVVLKKAAERMFGGEFRGGVFRSGEFRGGVFWGGEFWGGVFRQSPSCAQRSDGYMFIAHYVNNKLRIWAGCRDFSWSEAREHWGNPDHPRHAESMRIIKFLKKQAKAARRDHA